MGADGGASVRRIRKLFNQSFLMANREIISHINFARIEWCCGQLHISARDLAESVDVPLSKIKASPPRLTLRQLQKIADYFGCGVLFFLESGTPKADQIHSAQFRTLANQKSNIDRKLMRLLKNAENHRDFYLGLLEDMNERPLFSMPELSGRIADKARAVRKWLALDFSKNYQFSSYRKAIESKGILVFKSMAYQGAWKINNQWLIGFSIYHNASPVIFVKKTAEPRQTFTLMHELGHLLLHKSSRIDASADIEEGRSERERQANRFAGLCLLPAELLHNASRHLPKKIEDYDNVFYELSRKLGISREVVVRRLRDEKKITQIDYRKYMNHRKKKMKQARPDTAPATHDAWRYRHSEPKRIFGNAYVKTVLTALHANHITLKKASDYLDKLKIKDISKLEDSYARS